MLHHLCDHACTVDEGRTHFNAVVSRHEQHIIELNDGADLHLEPVDVQQLIAFNPVLLAAGADYRVNEIPPECEA